MSREKPMRRTLIACLWLSLNVMARSQAQHDVSQYYLFKIHKVDEDMPRIASRLQKAARHNRAQSPSGDGAWIRAQHPEQ
jgi:hypothetical protein